MKIHRKIISVKQSADTYTDPLTFIDIYINIDFYVIKTTKMFDVYFVIKHIDNNYIK